MGFVQGPIHGRPGVQSHLRCLYKDTRYARGNQNGRIGPSGDGFPEVVVLS